MKQKFHFDKKSGTIVPSNEAVAQGVKANVHNEVVESKPTSSTTKPVFQKEKKIDVKSETINVNHNQIVKMKRVNHPTSIQLIDENDLPEAYLDTASTRVLMFRERDDYNICQISEEKSGKVLAYIGGYALQFNFNMAELNTMEKIEQCLQGIVKLFRHQIMNQNLRENPSEK